MTLSINALADGLGSMSPTGSEATAIDHFVSSFEDYFYDASVLGKKCTAGTLASASSALRGALTGMSTSGQAAAKIQDGIIAFWSAVASSAATIWATSPATVAATPPTGLGGIAAALSTAFTANTQGALSLADSAQAIATALHPLNLGGIASLAPPPPGATAPIL